MDQRNEKTRQEKYKWARSVEFDQYNTILAYYQVQSCLEHARGRSVLDLACGDGTLTELLRDHFDRVVAVDASGVHLDKAKERVPEAEFIESLI